MKNCLECGKEFDESKRTTPFWIAQYKSMGICADICKGCWKTEHNIEVKE
jgi:hypothetical protein